MPLAALGEGGVLEFEVAYFFGVDYVFVLCELLLNEFADCLNAGWVVNHAWG